VTARDVIEFRIEAPGEERDRLIGELSALGTLGLEETEVGLAVYFPRPPEGDPMLAAVARLADEGRGIRIVGPHLVAPTDWEREWRRGLEPRRIGPLWIRPSWCASEGQPELCIDPEQAFGSGEHATTRIALELLLQALRPGDRVLDVGTGSGVLALGALRLGAGAAIACDLERPACLNARDNAARNGLRFGLFCGTLAALAPGLRVELVVANLLWSELRPWIARTLAHATRSFVVSGALRRERDAVCAVVEGEGFQLLREAEEAQSGDSWWGARFDRPAR